MPEVRGVGRVNLVFEERRFAQAMIVVSQDVRIGTAGGGPCGRVADQNPPESRMKSDAAKAGAGWDPDFAARCQSDGEI